MGDEGKQLLWLLPKGWDLQDKVIVLGVGSVDWSGCRVTQECRLCLLRGWDKGLGFYLFTSGLSWCLFA